MQSLTRTMMNIAQLAGPIVGGLLYEIGGFKMPFILMGCIQTVMAFIAYPFLPDYDSKNSIYIAQYLLLLSCIKINTMVFIFKSISVRRGFEQTELSISHTLYSVYMDSLFHIYCVDNV